MKDALSHITMWLLFSRDLRNPIISERHILDHSTKDLINSSDETSVLMYCTIPTVVNLKRELRKYR